MTESEFLTRIDRHLERADRHMERGNELMVEVRDEVALTREEVEKSREERTETRLFMRDLTRRQEKITEQLVAQLAANTRKIDESTVQITRRLEDVGLEGRQQTQALMRMLDRLD